MSCSCLERFLCSASHCFPCFLSGVWARGTASLWNVAGHCDKRKRSLWWVFIANQCVRNSHVSCPRRKPGSTLLTSVEKKESERLTNSPITTKESIRDGDALGDWKSRRLLAPQACTLGMKPRLAGRNAISYFSALLPSDPPVVHPFNRSQSEPRVHGSLGNIIHIRSLLGP